MKTKLFTIVLLLLPFFCFACTCGGPRSFCEVVNLETNKGITIIEGKKVSQDTFTMDIKITKVHQGNENRSRITVLGDNGALCLVPTTLFEVGETLILALDDKTEENIGSVYGYDYDYDYSLSVCGLHFLRGKDAINFYTEEPEDISECIDACVESPKSPFYPNPSNGVFYARIDQNQVYDSSKEIIYVYDNSGRIVRELKVFDNSFVDSSNYIIEINLSDLGPGVYFIQHSLTQNNCNKINSSKVIIL